MSFSEQFYKKVNEKVKAWTDKREALKAEIEKQSGLADEYQAAIDKDMKKGPAGPKTAENSLNLQYAEKRRAAAENELLAFEKEPLYSLSEYDLLCDEIRDEYRGRANKDLNEIAGLIDKALSLLAEMHELAKEANKCEKDLKDSFGECGQSPAKVLEGSRYKVNGPAYWVVPFQATRTERALNEAKKDIGAKI